MPAGTDLIEIVLQWQNAGVAIFSMWLIERIKIAWPKIKTSTVGMRILPFLPLVPTCALVWLPIYDPAPNAGERILLGLILGAVAGWVYKVIRQVVQARVKSKSEK